jgi:hypothetical protein
LILTPNYRFKKFKETVKESTLNLWFLVGSLRKPASPFEFFSNTQNLKLLSSDVLIKSPAHRLLEFENFEKPGLRGYNKIQEPPNSGLGLSWLIIETKFASCQLV